MTNKNKIPLILQYFDEILPNAKCELNYTKDYELVIAVMLSAQTTDKAVNKVTANLFNTYKTLESLANASEDEVAFYIKQIGMYKVKAKNVIGISKGILESFNGKVPNDKAKLMTLPGVGNKTAGVILAELYNSPQLPVDTHVERVSKRLGLVKNTDVPIEIERKLKRIIPKEKWVKSHHQFIHFGRYHCLARNPKCSVCKIKDLCKRP